MLIGISVAMPIGPISTLAIKNCLTRGFAIGLATSLGASITEGFYGFVATGGLAFISHFLTTYASEVKIVSGVALIMLALYEIATAKKLGYKESEIHATKKSHGFFHTMFFTSFLTLGSPMTIALFIGVFASMGEQTLTGQEMAITVFGIFLGSVIWAFTMCGTVSAMRHKLPPSWIAGVKIFSALIIGSFGAYGIASIFLK